MSDLIPDIPDGNTGSTATQGEAEPDAPINAEIALQGTPMLQAVVGLAATRSRGLGGEITAGLLAGAFQQSAQDHQETKEELRAARTALDRVNQNLADCRKTGAVLEVRLLEAADGRHIRNLLIAVGTVLISISVDVYKVNTNTAAAMSLAGVALIVVGWFPAKRSQQ